MEKMKSIQELMKLAGRRAIVAGGAGHIGLAACESLMELGAKVVVLDQNEKSTKQRCDELNKRKYKGKAFPLVVDVSDEKKLRQAIKKSVGLMDGLDIIVHCTAFVGTTKYPGWVVPFPQQTVDAWDMATRVNLTSAFIMVQEALPFLKKSKNGSVVLVSSIHGVVAPDLNLYEGTAMGAPAAYWASKAGMIQLAKYLSTMLAPEVRTNCISPGGVWRNPNEDFHARYKKRTPLGRMATEEDFKGALAYLASDLSKYMTGQNLIIDGGYTSW